MTTLTISSGVTSSGLRVDVGGELIVDAGGHIQACSIQSGGSAFIFGFATGTFVDGAASAVVFSGGYASRTVLRALSEVLFVSPATDFDGRVIPSACSASCAPICHARKPHQGGAQPTPFQVSLTIPTYIITTDRITSGDELK